MFNIKDIAINLLSLIVLFVIMIFAINKLINIAGSPNTDTAQKIKEIENQRRDINIILNTTLPLNLKTLQEKGFFDSQEEIKFNSLGPNQNDFLGRVILSNKKLNLDLELERLKNNPSRGLSILDLWVWIYGIIITTVATFYKKIIEDMTNCFIERYGFWRKNK